jgi:hypothetical protein
MAPCPLISTTLRVFQRCPTSLTVVINVCKFSLSYESHFIQDIMVRLRRLPTSRPVMTVMHVLRHSTHWSTVIRKQNLLDRNDSTNMKNINQHEDDDYANSKSRASDRAIKQGTVELLVEKVTPVYRLHDYWWEKGPQKTDLLPHQPLSPTFLVSFLAFI